VDLVRFELTTSSMPFKKYQSLADSLAQNKRLSKRRRGLRWTPRGSFGTSGLHADSGTPHAGLARGVLSCARGCGLLYLLSSEGDNNRIPYKDDAHVGCRDRSSWPPIEPASQPRVRHREACRRCRRASSVRRLRRALAPPAMDQARRPDSVIGRDRR